MFEEIIAGKLAAKFRETAGIIFKDSDMGYLKIKISEHLKSLRITTQRDYFEKMIRDNGIESELDTLFSLLINRESSFFRYSGQFKLLEQQVIRGEEPYSIAAVISGSQHLTETIDYNILATDIVKKNIDFARAGIYDRNTIDKSFNNNNAFQALIFVRNNGHFAIPDRLKEKVEFRLHNLIKDEYPKQFDIIFCRNVIIYFDDTNKRRVLNKLVDALTPGGYLFLGHSEVPVGCNGSLKTIFGCDAVCYRKVD
jgi:chemotaxis protein methyltransferase CheR